MVVVGGFGAVADHHDTTSLKKFDTNICTQVDLSAGPSIGQSQGLGRGAMQQPAAPPARPPPPPPGSSTPAAGGGAYYGDKDDHGGRMHVSQYPGANALPQVGVAV